MDSKQIAAETSWKEDIEKNLDLAIIAAYEKGQIDYFDVKQAGGKILNNFEYYNTHEEVIEFIELLNNKWKIFDTVLAPLKHRGTATTEKDVINKLASYIKSQQTSS